MSQTVVNRERDLFNLAFELAFFIHANKEIAFFIAEDSLESLTSLLGYQKKNRPPSDRLRGFWKWGERTRPVRKTLLLDERQMLQWLVYRHSERWETQTEKGQDLYLPTEEDLVIRYVKHLVFLTIRRGSFYVTLGICSLLRQFDRRETRLFYDVLTQNDAARMKDTNYIGKQRLELLDKVRRRFDDLLPLSQSGNEKQLQLEPANASSRDLIYESLRRFSPWGTACVIGPAFDVTDIPDFYFHVTTDEENIQDLEDSFEMNRIHTVIHPDCLSQFVNGLSKYVRSLPRADLDSNCDFDATIERLVLPRFRNLGEGPPRADRFRPPPLGAEDYIRLERTLESRGLRKRSFIAERLTIYVDGFASYSFEPTSGAGSCVIPNDSSYVEVRGQDANGEVVLATLILPALEKTSGELEDSIVHSGGQKVSLRIKPIISGSKGADLELEVSYNPSESNIFSRIASATKRALIFLGHLPAVPSFTYTVAIVAAMIIFFAGVYLVKLRSNSTLESHTFNDTATSPSTSEKTPITQPSPIETGSPVAKKPQVNVAQVNWNTRPGAVLSAIPIELTRAERQKIDLTRGETRLALSLPLYDSEGLSYSNYRITLSAEQTNLWRQTLMAPKKSLTRYANVLDIVLFNQQLRAHHRLGIRVEGRIRGRWLPIGELELQP